MESGGKQSRRWGRLAVRIVRTPLVVYLLVLLMMMILENSMIFFPMPYPQGSWQPPVEVEDAWFTADDGAQLHGWYAHHDNPRAVLLFAHGNAGNITHRVDRLGVFNRRFGMSVLIFDYRGYGRSQGRPDEPGVLADARAARAWLARRAGVAEEQIVLMGESLGGGVVVDLAAADGARGLILESTFTSLPDTAAVHYPWLPVRLLMRSRLDSLSKIGRYRGPLLWSHGTEDRVVPYALGRRLFDAANEPKQGITLQGVGHCEPPFPEECQDYAAALEKFLDSLEPLDTATDSPALATE